jgi:hypothetical protein
MTKEYPLYYTYANVDYEFLFALEHQRNPADVNISEYGMFPYISCKLYRKDIKDFYWEWSGILEPNQKIEFQLIYADRIDIKGSICLFHSKESGYNFVFMDSFFGMGYEEHFEGNVLEIDRDPGPFPPVPPKPTPKPTPLPPDEMIGPADFRDLFPYLYMQYWPNLQPEDEIYLVNPPPDFNTSPFYSKLVQLSTGSNARVAMETEALSYINGTGAYSNDFIISVNELLYPLNIFPEIYDEIYIEELCVADEIIVRLNNKKEEGTEELLMTSSYPQQIQRIWENILALNIIEGFESYKLDQLTKILTVNHIISYLSSPPVALGDDWLKQLIHASLVLPANIFPLPPFGATLPVKSIYTGTIVPYAIGDLQMVQHKLKGYEPGEIAHIENVLTGEVKRTIKRKTELIKDTLTRDKENLENKRKDDYGDMLEKQVNKTIADSISDTYNYQNLTVSYGPPTTGTYGGQVTNTKTRTLNEQSPVEFAKKVLSRTVSHLDEKISERRENIIRNETEESVSHVIDNRKGRENIRGIYYWLNRIYEMRLVNYGHRFLLEFLIQKPQVNELDQVKGPFLFPPISPQLLPNPIRSYKDITVDNYLSLGDYYDVYTFPFPPSANRIVNSQLNGNEFLCSTQIPVPDGYLPESLSASFQLQADAILIAGITYNTIKATDNSVTVKDPMGIFTGTPIQIAAQNLGLPVLLEMTPVVTSPPSFPSYFMSLSLNCKCSDQYMDTWRQEVYDIIQKAYADKVRKYELYMQEQYRTNPQVVDRIIQKMVKTSCKNVLWEQHLKINGESSPPLSPPEDLVNKPAYSQFFEEAFEWDKMIYGIEHSMPVTAKEDLVERLDNRLYDDKLERFLSSQNVRVIVPLTGEFHYKMLYYLSSGLIFYGIDHLAPVFSADQSLAVKLKKVFDLCPFPEVGEIEKWNVKVPTEMQWLEDTHELPILKQ